MNRELPNVEKGKYLKKIISINQDDLHNNGVECIFLNMGTDNGDWKLEQQFLTTDAFYSNLYERNID